MLRRRRSGGDGGHERGRDGGGSRAREGAVERTVLAARTGTRGESAGLSLSMQCRDGARVRGDRGLHVAALRGSEGRKGGEGIERWALPVDAVCGGGQGPRGREMDQGDRAELRLGLERGAGWAADGPKRPA